MDPSEVPFAGLQLPRSQMVQFGQVVDKRRWENFHQVLFAELLITSHRVRMPCFSQVETTSKMNDIPRRISCFPYVEGTLLET